MPAIHRDHRPVIPSVDNFDRDNGNGRILESFNCDATSACVCVLCDIKGPQALDRVMILTSHPVLQQVEMWLEMNSHFAQAGNAVPHTHTHTYSPLNTGIGV